LICNLVSNENDNKRSAIGEPDRDDARQEFHHLDRVAALTVKEIETIPHLLHRDCILLRAVLQDQLLEEQERPFMWHFLAHLHECLPRVFRGQLRTVWTLPVLHEVLELERLLQNRVRQNLLRGQQQIG
jgi:hypothetical protein